MKERSKNKFIDICDGYKDGHGTNASFKIDSMKLKASYVILNNIP